MISTIQGFDDFGDTFQLLRVELAALADVGCGRSVGDKLLHYLLAVCWQLMLCSKISAVMDEGHSIVRFC